MALRAHWQPRKLRLAASWEKASLLWTSQNHWEDPINMHGEALSKLWNISQWVLPFVRPQSFLRVWWKRWDFVKSINACLYLQGKSDSQFQGICGCSKTTQMKNPSFGLYYSHMGTQNCSIISTAFPALQTSNRLSCGQSDYSCRCLKYSSAGSLGT